MFLKTFFKRIKKRKIKFNSNTNDKYDGESYKSIMHDSHSITHENNAIYTTHLNWSIIIIKKNNSTKEYSNNVCLDRT